jgi:amino acid adenylation domain-containing protein
MSSSLQNGVDLSAAEKRALLADLLREKATRAKIVPTSFAQQRLWFLGRLEPDNSAYNIPRPLRINGELNVPVLRQTLNEILARHEVLRGSFDLVDGRPVQVIAPRVNIDLPVIDLEGLSDNERAAEVSRLAIADADRPFDLTRAPLLRGCLLRLAEREHVLLLTMHHIVSDGWSIGILVREIAAIYQAINAGEPAGLPELPIQYADFARWQRDWLRGEVLEEQLSYWKQQLSGAPAVLDLPIARPRPAMQTMRGSHLSSELSLRLNGALSELSRREGVTLFMTLLAAFQTVLSRYSGQDDFVIGSPIAGRNRAELEGLIGFFVNSLPLRTSLAGNPSFRELLGRVKETALGAYAHQDLPFEKMVEGLQPPRSLSYPPIFQIMFALQNQPAARFSLPGLDLAPLKREFDTAKFDLTLFMTEHADGLGCWLEYNTDLFEQATIRRLLVHFETLLNGIVADPDQLIGELPLLEEDERRQVLVDWNHTQADYPSAQCIHQLFAEQVAKTPDAIAVACEDQQLTYAQLNRKANQLAHYLTGLGVGPEITVGLYLERGLDVVVGLLGILKAGGAYVPLDPAFPKERLQFMFQDSNLAVLLTQESLIADSPSHSAKVVRIDADWETIAKEREEDPAAGPDIENLAYVIYTSGSTGLPKGVQVTHRALTNLLWSMRQQPGINSTDVLLSVTTLSFDIAGLEFYLPLIAGARLEILSQEPVAEGTRLKERLEQGDVTVMQATPAGWRMLVDLGWQGSRNLKILCGGEALPDALRKDLLARGAELWNMYGPTEATIWSTAQRIESTEEPITIGRPIANTQVYVLDRSKNPTPIGVPGELHIGGVGLARGYLNNPDLTAAKFIANERGDLAGSRLYQTGDFARYLADGTIECLGRIDNQVKLRGFRIEPGEIEAVLRTHSDIRDAVVMLRESPKGNQALVAYVVAESIDSTQAQNLTAALRTLLKTKLPDYMVPSYFVLLAELPLTPNGKIDRKALPLPDRSYLGSEQARSAPRNQVEEQLARIWKELLELEQVGVTDNFFELGGHSLLAVRLLSEIEKVFGQKIPLVSLFRHTTIESLAEELSHVVETTAWPTLVEIQKGDNRPPLFCVSMPNVNALGYVALARHLGAEQSVYGLQAQYPEDLQGEHSQKAVEELATEYLDAIRTKAPHGPYQFVGMCRGAHIAFEMARRLRDQGEEVSLVGILDTWVLENTYNKFLYVEYYARRLRASLRFGPKGQLDRLRKNTSQPDSSERKTEQSENGARQLSNPMQAYFPGPDFQPKTYAGRVAVFRARKQPLNRIRDKELGWGKLATGGIDLHYVSGKHGASVLREPHVQVLAAEVKKHLVKR